MHDGRTRVTVVGARRKVDLALPSAAPIAEYSAGLAKLCARPDAASAVWSFAAAGTAPLALTTSLAESGIVDGQILYLRDVTRDPGDDPTVADLDELIENEADAQRSATLPRPFIVMSLGLVWLVAAAILAVRYTASAPVTSAVCLIVTGLLLLATAWALTQHRLLTPPLLCVLTSLAAVPCIAAGAALLGQALAGDAFLWPAAFGGATAALLMSLAATPEPVILLLGLPLGMATLLAPLLLIVHATAVQVAAATVIAMLSVIGLAKASAAMVTVWSQHQPIAPVARPHAATMLLIRWRRLLTVLLAGPAIALAVALAMLASAGGAYAPAMAATASISLLVRAKQSGFSAELVPIGGAGLTGIFAVLAALAERLWHNDTASTAALLIGGLLLIGGAVISAVTWTAPEPAVDMPPGFPSAAARPSARRRFIDILGALCLTVTVCLALGVFGVIDGLMLLGRGIIG
jgi:hypothetical protein